MIVCREKLGHSVSRVESESAGSSTVRCSQFKPFPRHY